MAKNQPLETDYPAPARRASAASLDGYRRLALGAVVQSIADFYDPDPVKALDGLLFILDPLGAAYWLDACGVSDGDPCTVFRRATNGKAAKRTQLSRRFAG